MAIISFFPMDAPRVLNNQFIFSSRVRDGPIN
jgi:hypothetical protein